MSDRKHFEGVTASLSTEESSEGMVGSCKMVLGGLSYVPYHPMTMAKPGRDSRLPTKREINVLSTDSLPQFSKMHFLDDKSKLESVISLCEKDLEFLQEKVENKNYVLSMLKKKRGEQLSVSKPSYAELMAMSTIDEGTGQQVRARADPLPAAGDGGPLSPTFADLLLLCPISDD